jgi:hypothetical protein
MRRDQNGAFRNRVEARVECLYLLSIFFGSAALTGCTALDGQNANLTGQYVLQSVNEQPLPVTVTVASCSRSLASGDLRMDPAAADARPFFLWEVRAFETCGGSTKDIGVEQRDVGRWSQSADETATFDSSVDGSKYQVHADPVEGRIEFAYGGRRYSFRRQ